MLEMLLLVGTLTTPPQPAGMSLSEYWAWLRYMHAFSAAPDLRLASPFADLDSHQKTILSDDWGMGIPMHWLVQHLGLGLTSDGRYFMARSSSLTGQPTPKTTKRGPSKSPDFVSYDAAGVWHVIECKGTQSGLAYLRRQIGAEGPPRTGAVAQKTTILFPTGHTGQRLACGVHLSFEGGKEATTLLVRDPPAERVLSQEEPFSLGQTELYAGIDAVLRSSAARGLRMAGYVDTASALAAPSGRMPDARPQDGLSESHRLGVVEEKRRRAEQELSARVLTTVLERGGDKFQGRQVSVTLPRPLLVGSQTVKSVRVSQGVNQQVLDALASRPLIEEPLQNGDTAWREALGETKFAGGDFEANLTIGTFFASRIELLT
jgi:hypothetical protein